MKKSLIIFPILIFIGLLFSTLPVRDAQSAGEELDNIVLDVEGMTCPSCPATIKTALKRLNGVIRVDVSYLKGTATVEYHKEKVTPDQMIKAIEGIGYRAMIQHL